MMEEVSRSLVGGLNASILHRPDRQETLRPARDTVDVVVHFRPSESLEYAYGPSARLDVGMLTPNASRFYGPLAATGYWAKTEPVWSAPASCMRWLGRAPGGRVGVDGAIWTGILELARGISRCLWRRVPVVGQGKDADQGRIMPDEHLDHQEIWNKRTASVSVELVRTLGVVGRLEAEAGRRRLGAPEQALTNLRRRREGRQSARRGDESACGS